MERRLDTPESDGVAHRRLDEVGQGFALPEYGLELGAQFRLDADLGNDGGLHPVSVLRVGYARSGGVPPGVTATLPLDDKRDFDEAKKGFIAEPPFMKIMADAGHVAWATLINIKGVQAVKPDRTITVNRSDLNQVMMGASSFDDLIKAGKAKLDGDRKPFDQLRGLMVTFAPNFEILPGTAAKAPAADLKAFEVPDVLPPDGAGD
ncbi:MAG TPA: alkyl sulfatase C-terminal domain-containing protein [Rubrivivax sp.]|nr:alkyl sulfatase C-terminal domain-containing protein [Rubrivivax sp.]